MFDVTIVAAVTVGLSDDVPNEYPYTVSHVTRLDLEGDAPNDIENFIDYIRAYKHVVHLAPMTEE